MCFVTFQVRKLQGFAGEFQNLQLFHVSIMLRNRYRSVTHKQALMADHHTSSQPIPYFFNSPRFKAFTTSYLPKTESIKSPTSILDDHNKPLFPLSNPFGSHSNKPKSPKHLESKGIGLAIVDTHNDDKPIEDKDHKIPSKTSKKNMVLFGTKLKVQIPQIPPSLVYPNTSHLTSSSAQDSPQGCLPIREMELSEDYTCVKSHGPNPKTTHIYDNCVINNYCNSVLGEPKCGTESNFLSFCHTCKKDLQQKIDIYIYRGEKAFCSQECRFQEMILHGEED